MFEFAWPWLFLLLPLPWLIRRVLPAAGQHDHNGLRVPFYTHIAALCMQSNAPQLNQRQWLAYVVWALLVVAAAGPRWVGAPIELPRSGRDIMLALDLSGSMQIPDMTWDNQRVDRLTVVKGIANQFIERRQGDRLGLILFGTKAYLQTPLTFDRKTVQAMINDATIGLPGPQTAIGDAIGLAIKRLQRYPDDSRILILLTDGENNAGTLNPLSAATIAKQNHVKIYTIGLGAESLPVQGLLGQRMINPSADLDINALKKIAATTGGKFFRARSTTELEQVYQDINNLEPTISDNSLFRPTQLLYVWPLSIAFLLSVLNALSYLGYFTVRMRRYNMDAESQT